MTKPDPVAIRRADDIPADGTIYLDAPTFEGLNNGEKRIMAQECGMPYQRLSHAMSVMYQAAKDEGLDDEAKVAALTQGDLDTANVEYGLGRIALRRLSMSADIPENAERVALISPKTDPTPAA